MHLKMFWLTFELLIWGLLSDLLSRQPKSQAFIEKRIDAVVKSLRQETRSILTKPQKSTIKSLGLPLQGWQQNEKHTEAHYYQEMGPYIDSWRISSNGKLLEEQRTLRAH